MKTEKLRSSFGRTPEPDSQVKAENPLTKPTGAQTPIKVNSELCLNRVRVEDSFSARTELGANSGLPLSGTLRLRPFAGDAGQSSVGTIIHCFSPNELDSSIEGQRFVNDTIDEFWAEACTFDQAVERIREMRPELVEYFIPKLKEHVCKIIHNDGGHPDEYLRELFRRLMDEQEKLRGEAR